MCSIYVLIRTLLLDWSCRSSKVIHFFRACLCSQLCLTLCDPVDHSPPASSVYVILQARILEWVAISLGQSPFKMQEPVLNVNVNMLYECVLLIQPWMRISFRSFGLLDPWDTGSMSIRRYHKCSWIGSQLLFSTWGPWYKHILGPHSWKLWFDRSGYGLTSAYKLPKWFDSWLRCHSHWYCNVFPWADNRTDCLKGGSKPKWMDRPGWDSAPGALFWNGALC